MNKSAQRYIDMAFEYHVSALTLYTSIFDAPYLYNPTIFLLRHTVELVLKGLIIHSEKGKHQVSIKNINAGGKNINSQHSLLALWNHFNKIASPIIEADDFTLIHSAISKLDKKDFSSTRYRYPYKRGGAKTLLQTPLEPVEINVADKAPDLADGIPWIAISSGRVGTVDKGNRLLCDLISLFDVVELLFELAET